MENQKQQNTGLATGEKTPVATKPSTTVQTGVKKPVVVNQKYRLIPVFNNEIHHVLPKDLRTYNGKVSSEFRSIDGQGTSTVLRALTTEQERYFSTRLIEKSAKDFGYDEMMLTYWLDFTVDVPEKGILLDASYEIKTVEVDGEKVEMEIPVYLDQYIKAKFCMQSSRVAFYPDEIENKSLFSFVMEDLSVVEKTKLAAFKLVNQATDIYIQLVKSVNDNAPNEKIDFLLDVLKKEDENFYSADLQTKLMRIKEISEKQPLEFIEANENPNLEYEALLFRLTQTRVIVKEGNMYFNGDEKMGTQREAIEWLKDQTNSGQVNILKARLQEMLKGGIRK